MEVDGDLTDEIMQMSTEDINFRSQMLGEIFQNFEIGVFYGKSLHVRLNEL